MSKFFKFNYESEIRLSLLLFILFFVLINYGIVYLLDFSKNAWKEDYLQNLKGAGFSVSQLWQNSSEITEREAKFRTLLTLWGLEKLEIFDQEGKILFSTDGFFQKKTSAYFWLADFKSELSLGRSFFSTTYSGPEKKLYQSYFCSFVDNTTQRMLWVRVEKEAGSLVGVERILKYEGWVRAVGILGILFLSFLLFKNIFSPFEKMKRKAEEEKLISPAGKSGDVEMVVEIFQKVISELKDKERKLQELFIQTDNRAKNLERYNEYILRSINNGVIICDNQGKITGFNQAAQRLLGPVYKLSIDLHYREALGQGKTLSLMLDEMVLKKRSCAEAELETRDYKGESRFLMTNGNLLRDEKENIIGLVLVLTDLTELKRIQQEMVFKQKMASLGEISAGLAHELRNSMGALMGFCKMLKKGIKEGSAAYAVVESIMAESITLENLLQRFLDFAKPLEVKRVDLDIVELVQDCIKIAQERKPELKFTLRVEAKFPYVSGDPLLLKQVFQNLIQNSIEALPSKGEMKIRLQKIKENGESFALIVLEDNGCGISEENLEKVFRPFFTTKEKGVGLGLSLVKKIIDLHKGKIEVRSTPGKGTAFSLSLPITLSDSKPKGEKIINIKSPEVIV